jgi:dihydrofolate synthase/folylpolyglutamate synthase
MNLKDKNETIYQETLDRINGFQKFGSRLGLERMKRLMELLGNPQEKMKVIHVAGTNGKGSVCRYLYSVLQENGYKTGLYTSPFLERFTERIEFNGSEISPESLAQYTELVIQKVDVMVREGMDSPTEFELITAIAFLYFSQQDMDFLILEVGLGGIGDSTNMVSRPLASVITSISFDHMEYLGDTLEKIAYEKAGIIKPGTPVIYHVDDEGARRTIERAADEKGAERYDASAVPFVIKEKTVDGYTFDTEINGVEYQNLRISMIGRHQISNAICALIAVEILKQQSGVPLERDKIYSGFFKARQTGRFEVLRKNPYVIIDGAHNEAGVGALKDAVKEHFPTGRILVVVGMLADKKIDRLIEKFGMITDEFIATEPDSPRRLSADELCKQIKNAGKQCTVMENPEDACKYIEGLTGYDAVVFAGSLYLIGKVRGMLNHEKEQSTFVL